jgi:cell division protein FtsI (penicillin-binding protein 3)
MFYNRAMRDAKNGGYGTITVREAFEKSSNVGISKLVDKYFGSSPSKFMAYIQKVGLNEPFNFQLAGEGKPFFKKPGTKNWYGTSLAWTSIGYEIKLNPLHTLALYNAVANKGTMVKPYLIKAISNGNKIQESFQPEVIRSQIASEKTIQQLQELLEGVVTSGTAKNIANTDYKIAGKTGTAQKLINGAYTKKYYTSFVGYFPADRPKYSMIIVIDSPNGFAAYGGDVCAPVFKEIADKIYALDMELNPGSQKTLIATVKEDRGLPYFEAGKAEEFQQIFEELGLKTEAINPEEWVKTVGSDGKVRLQVNDTDKAIVPDVSGLALRDALFILENKGLQVNYSGKGRVKAQSLAPGTKLSPNATINLVLG